MSYKKFTPVVYLAITLTYVIHEPILIQLFPSRRLRNQKMLFFAPNQTGVSALTDETGNWIMDIASFHLNIVIYVALPTSQRCTAGSALAPLV